MSSTIPCLKGFMKGFTTGGMGYTDTTNFRSRRYGGHKPSNGSGGIEGSYQMQSMSKSRKASVPLGDSSSVCQESYGAGIRMGLGEGGGGSLNSQESQEVMIKSVEKQGY